VSPWLVNDVLNIPPELREDATTSFLILAAAMPLSLMGSAWRGYLEALQRFDILMVVTTLMSLLSYGAPAVLVQFVPSLPAVVALVALSRAVAFGVILAVALRVTPELRQRIELRRGLIRTLARYGGWVSLTNVAGSTIATLDRFVVGAVLSASAVAFYATPADATGRMLIASAALVNVLFPAFALNFRHEPERAAALFRRGLDYTFIALFPISLLLVAFAPEILDFWLGGQFPEKSAFVMQWLAAGALMTGLAQVMFGFVQSDRPDLNAKLFAIELPLYVVGILVATHRWGVDGTAVASAARAALDAVCLGVLAAVIQPPLRSRLRRQALIAAGGLAVLGAAGQLNAPGQKAVFVAVTLSACAGAAWKRLLEDADRALIRARLGRIRVGGARS
jgi:O-antigen/teichoic acid export membrane protein